MQHKRFKLSTILLLGLGLTGLQAQESINASGANATGSRGSMSYSIGQVAYQAHIITNGSTIEGVQQPYEISVVTTIGEAKGINISVTAYPNPTNDFIQLKVENEKLKGLSYQLYDMSGKLLQSKKITGNKTTIAISNLLPTSYFVKVIQGNKEIKTFKIIKN